tara:strand:+ start:692 stop:829 length:138 start_codon:yes stop_codon:yes gene_type:complete
MTEEDIKYRQGRSKEQYESSTKGAMIAYIGCIILGIYSIIEWVLR